MCKLISDQVARHIIMCLAIKYGSLNNNVVNDWKAYETPYVKSEDDLESHMKLDRAVVAYP
jgi:hypothetical protein